MQIPYTSSELSSVIRSANPTLRAAIDNTPDIATALSRLSGFRAAVEAVVDEPSDTRIARLTEEVRQAVDTGEPIPRRLLDDVADSGAGDRARVVIREFLARLDQEYAQDADLALRGGVDALYGHLHAQLTATLAVGRSAAADLIGVGSADIALRAGVGDQWVALTDARAEFCQILDAQTLVETKVERVERDARHLAIAHIANALQVWPDLPRWARYGYTQDAHGNRAHLTPPWPDVKTERPGLFDWFIAHPDAQGWVPTIGQRQAVRVALTKAEDDLGPRQGPRNRAGAARWPQRGAQTYPVGSLAGVTP